MEVERLVKDLWHCKLGGRSGLEKADVVVTKLAIGAVRVDRGSS